MKGLLLRCLGLLAVYITSIVLIHRGRMIIIALDYYHMTWFLSIILHHY